MIGVILDPPGQRWNSTTPPSQGWGTPPVERASVTAQVHYGAQTSPDLSSS